MLFFLDHFIDFVVFQEIEKISIGQSRVAAKEFRKKLLLKIVRRCRQARTKTCATGWFRSKRVMIACHLICAKAKKLIVGLL